MKTDEQVAHTATPWKLDGDMTINAITDGDGIEQVVTIAKANISPSLASWEREANAQFIVTACNSHAALVSALRAATELLEKFYEKKSGEAFVRGELPILWPEIKNSREALRKAGAL